MTNLPPYIQYAVLSHAPAAYMTVQSYIQRFRYTVPDMHPNMTGNSMEPDLYSEHSNMNISGYTLYKAKRAIYVYRTLNMR